MAALPPTFVHFFQSREKLFSHGFLDKGTGFVVCSRQIHSDGSTSVSVVPTTQKLYIEVANMDCYYESFQNFGWNPKTCTTALPEIVFRKFDATQQARLAVCQWNGVRCKLGEGEWMHAYTIARTSFLFQKPPPGIETRRRFLRDYETPVERTARTRRQLLANAEEMGLNLVNFVNAMYPAPVGEHEAEDPR